MYKVYKHVSPNGKVYIGITNQKPSRRWGKNGQGYKENDYFYRAIKKHGWNNFRHIIIADGLTEEEACELEIKLIEKYNSTDRSCGYNRHFGGKVHDTVSKNDLLKGNFKSYDDIRNSPILYDVFKKLVASALGCKYEEEIETFIYKNGNIAEIRKMTETKYKKPCYFAICLLLEHYKEADEVFPIISELTALKRDIEEDL